MLGLHCCLWTFSSCGEWGLPLTIVHKLIAVDSLIAEHSVGFKSCSAWVWLPHSVWNLPEPGIKPMSPALAGGFLANEPPGKSNEQNFEPDI